MARRFHILSGHFASFEAAQAYCYDTETINDPEQINLEQPDASIDADYVEIGYKDAITHMLSDLFDAATASGLLAVIGSANTVITIGHTGLLGGDAQLATNDTLTYLGLFHEVRT
ncbi:hypothetical protein [Algirhabdus cladophorae]|uniref:hypothetical protein n=1 Tax=Algirhabdus cladophorae TaxID=3377108 RepID=UPI003B84583E